MKSQLTILLAGFLCVSLRWNSYGAWTNNLGMVFVDISIPASSNISTDVSASSEANRKKFNPVKKIWLSVTETTQDQWLKIMSNNPSAHKGGDLPVEMVSWEQAVEFCHRLSIRDGFVYRLATEAEWNLAAGSINNSAIQNAGKYAWTLENATNTHPVAQLKPNSLGLFDMQGNVAEWCLDVKVYKDPKGNTRDDCRIVKGGAFCYFAKDAQPTTNMFYPGGTNEDYRAGFIGFRVLRE